MSYTVLARRYRSNNFDEIVGQEHIAQTLKKAIESGRIAHAFLFCGSRGTGKTSTARILAKALNCEKYDKPTPTPCGKCASCQAIARGEDIDVIEIDAASNTGVDNVREIIENSRYSPTRSRFKVYIIDETHMLSKSAFNALLKTLEEPPSHVKFILATTEPEKVLPTILSRCQRYDFHNIPVKLIAGHLKEICKTEKIEADEDALLLLARGGAGSMRDSLSLLDRLLSTGEKRLTAAGVEELLGLPKAQLMLDLAQSIGEGDVKKTLTQSEAMLARGMSADVLLSSLAEHLRGLLVARVCGQQSDLLQTPGISPQQWVKQAGQFEAVTLTQDIAIVEELRRNLRQSPGNRALLDATLARLALAGQFARVEELLGRIDASAGGAVQKKKLDIVVVEESELGSNAAAEVTPDESPISPETRNPKPETPISDLPSIWPEFLNQCGSLGMAVSAAMKLARPGGIVDGLAIIHLPATYVRQWNSNGKREVVARTLSILLKQPVGVRFEVDGDPQPEGSRVAEATGPAADDAAREAIKSDPLVAAIIEQFGAEIKRIE